MNTGIDTKLTDLQKSYLTLKNYEAMSRDFGYNSYLDLRDTLATLNFYVYTQSQSGIQPGSASEANREFCIVVQYNNFGPEHAIKLLGYKNKRILLEVLKPLNILCVVEPRQIRLSRVKKYEY